MVNNAAATISVTDNVINNNGSDGMWLGSSALFNTLTVTDNYIQYNSAKGINIPTGTVGNIQIHHNDIVDNVLQDIANAASSNIVDATDNWWGDQSGPYDSSDDRATGGWYNPNGLGGSVTDYVKYFNVLGHSISVIGAPNAPTLVLPGQGISITGTAIVFVWGLNPDTTKYWLEVNTDPDWGSGTMHYSAEVSATSQMVTGFPNNGTTYYWRVSAGNSNGWSDWSERSFVNGNAPPPPPAPNLVAPALGAFAGGTSIRFQWQASTGATMYWLEVNSDPGWDSDTRLFYASAQGTSQLVGGFPNHPETGTTFYWRVMAGNDYGLSAPSPSSFTNIGPPAPAPPVLVSPSNGAVIVSSSITFQWQASSGATYYWLEVNSDPNWGSATRKFYNSVATTSQVVDGFLQDGTNYFWRVWAGDAQGLGDPSGRNFFMLPIPVEPTLIYPNHGDTIIQPESVIFIWTSPKWATKYFLEINSDPGWGSQTRLFYEEVSGTSKTVTGFTLDTTYYWRVSAGNVLGWSSPSTFQAVTIATIPIPETPTLYSPTNGANVAGTSVTFVWSASNWATTYRLEVNTDPAWGTDTRFYYASMSTNSQTVTGFPNNGTTYYWRVWAGNSAGWSAAAERNFVNGTQGSGLPATPTLTSPSNPSNVPGSSILFQWSASSGATNYWLEVNTDQNWGTAGRFYNAGMSTNSQTVTGFPNNGTTYYWRVWAWNSYGWSAASAVWSVVNGTQASAPPAAPTLSSPTNGANMAGTSITFQWSYNVGATTYWLEVNRDQNWGTAGRVYNAGMSSTAQTVTGFPDNGTTYYWRVWAWNSYGWSAASAVWSVINGFSVPPETPALTSPTDGASMAGNYITFQWSAANGAKTYWLEVNRDPAWGTAGIFYNAGGISTNSQTVTGFPLNGTTYYWRVWAWNSAGWSAASAVRSFHNP
jgi:hypothetical protein